jgi:hypothetical protein
MRITENRLRGIIRKVIRETRFTGTHTSQVIYPREKQVNDMWRNEKDRLKGRRYFQDDHGKSAAFLERMRLDSPEVYDIAGVYFEKKRVNPNHNFRLKLKDFPENTRKFLVFYFELDTKGDKNKSILEQEVSADDLHYLVTENFGLDEDEF